VAASLPYDPLLGRIRIKKLFFDKTDPSPGRLSQKSLPMICTSNSMIPAPATTGGNRFSLRRHKV
jgi:hypothetical protein